MISGMITGLAAISGSLVGAPGSAAGTWITQKHQHRRDLLGEQIVRREALYSDFIAGSARLMHGRRGIADDDRGRPALGRCSHTLRHLQRAFRERRHFKNAG